MIVRLFSVPSKTVIEHLSVLSLMVELRVVTLEAPTVFCRAGLSVTGASCLYLSTTEESLHPQGEGAESLAKRKEGGKEVKGHFLMEQQHVDLGLVFFWIRSSFITYWPSSFHRAWVVLFLSVQINSCLYYIYILYIYMFSKVWVVVLSYVRCWDHCATFPHLIGEKAVGKGKKWKDSKRRVHRRDGNF